MAFQQRPAAEQPRKDSAGARSAISSLLFKAGPNSAAAAAASQRRDLSPTRGGTSSSVFISTAGSASVSASGIGSPSTLSYSALSTPSSPKGSPSLVGGRPSMSPPHAHPHTLQHRRTSSHSRYPSFSMPLSEVGEDDVLPPIPQEERLERSPPASPRHREAVPVISRNVSFMFASPTAVASPPLGPVEENGSVHTTPLHGTLPLPTGTRPRSRRSSTALAVSVSLASRSRSRSSTPNNVNPPHGRSPQTSPPMQGVHSITKQLGEFAWDEAFAHDGDDDLDMTFDDGDAPAPRKDRSARSSRLGRSSTQRSRGDYSDHMHDGRLSDVFPLGHVFGAGHSFEGEIIEAVTPRRLASNGREVPVPQFALGHHRRASLERGEIATKSFKVVRQLGSGSFAVVYLVREIGGVGQEYALKCLSKKDLDGDQLESQMFEATIHLSLPRHENVVTLHQALQTRKWLFLLMEMCPGEDLFYWLEHSRDSPPNTSSHANDDFHDERNAPLSSSALPSSAVPFSSGSVLAGMGTSFASTSPAFSFSPLNHHVAHGQGHANGHHGHGGHHHNGSIAPSQTPTTPSLLAAYSAGALLSNRRLRLISSMFAQMCEAIALCHDVGVSHRDIKPENFICCDSQELSALPRDDTEAAFYEKRKVIVKLTDFGLATSEERNTDVECGSRPYMAFECRNNLGPDYAPAPADVWSLGIVLINMLFHRQPWADPVQGDYNFDDFIASPTDFLLNKFTGIGREVATFLAEHVFSLHVENRVSAREFGHWARNLPIMIGGRKAVSALKASRHDDPDGRETIRFTKNALGHKYTQTSLMSSNLAQTTPEKKSSGQSNGHSKKHTEAVQEEQHEVVEAVVADDIASPTAVAAEPEQSDDHLDHAAEEPDMADEPEGSIRSSISGKRKKRGSRKCKAAQAAAAAIFAGLPPPPSERDTIIAELAKASETLAREMSKTHKPAEPEIDMLDFPRLGETSAPAAEKAKKESKLKSYLNSKNLELRALAQKVQERDGPRGNVSAPAQLQHGVRTGTSTVDSATSSVTSSTLSQLQSTRSHTVGGPTPASRAMAVDNWRKPVAAATEGHATPSSPLTGPKRDLHDSARIGAGGSGDRQHYSPVSSLYTTESNHSRMTVSSFATTSAASTMSSASGGSAFSVHTSASSGKSQGSKSNVKQMDGIPWELDLLPRQLQLDSRGQTPQGDIFSRPPPPVRKLKLSGGLKPVTTLESISERPANPPPATMHAHSFDSNAGSSGFTISEASLRGTARPPSPPAASFQATSTMPPKTKSGMSFGKMFGIKSGKKD